MFLRLFLAYLGCVHSLCTYGSIPCRGAGNRLACWLETSPTGDPYFVDLSQTASAGMAVSMGSDMYVLFDATTNYVRKYTWNPTTFKFDVTATIWNIQDDGALNELQIYRKNNNLAIYGVNFFDEYTVGGVLVPAPTPSTHLIDPTFYPSVGTSYRVAVAGNGNGTYLTGFGQAILRFDSQSTRQNPSWTQTLWSGVTRTGIAFVPGVDLSSEILVAENDLNVYKYGGSNPATGSLFVSVPTKIIGMTGNSAFVFVETSQYVYVFNRATAVQVKRYNHNLGTGSPALFQLDCTFDTMDQYVPPVPTTTEYSGGVLPPAPATSASCPTGSYVCVPPAGCSTCSACGPAPCVCTSCMPCPGTPAIICGTRGVSVPLVFSYEPPPTESVNPCNSASYWPFHCNECIAVVKAQSKTPDAPCGFCCNSGNTASKCVCPTTAATATIRPTGTSTGAVCSTETDCALGQVCVAGGTGNSVCQNSAASFSLF